LAGEIGISRTACAHEPGTYRRDQNVVFREFRTQPLTVPDQGKFAGGVRKKKGKATLPPIEAMFTIRPKRRCFIAGKTSRVAKKGSPKISLHGVFERFGGLILGWSNQHCARITHKDVDVPEFGPHCLNDAADSGANSDVTWEREGRATGISELLAYPLKFTFTASANRNANAALGEFARQHQTESA
jgi:hypothetical protein